MRIPKTLDAPMRCLGIPMDSLMVFMSIMTAFMMLDQGLYGAPCGVIAAFIFARFRNRSMTRKIVRLMYWYLPAELNFIQGIQGHQRRLICKR